MNTKFKRHQAVKLLSVPSDEDIEMYADPPISIPAGTPGKINMLLPNGRYHVKIEDAEGNEIAYIAADEEQLEAL